MTDLFALFATFALIVIALLAVMNTLVFPRLRPVPAMPRGPLVSVLIPARNESAVIADTVRGVLSQAGANLELIVLDDNSTDGTAEIARAAGAGDPRLRVLCGAALPQGWLGKNWACHQMAGAARGALLLFSDADVRWQSGALASLLAMHERTSADLLTIWPTQHTETWGERLVVPLMALAILGYLPLPLVHFSPFGVFAAANGQIMLFRREVYQRIGGHAAVRANIVEDVTLARRTKQAGLRLRMADGAGLIGCRMYRSWPAVRDGFGKNILAGHGDSVPFLALSTAFHLTVFLWPWLWLVAQPGIWSLGLVALGVGVRALTAAATRQRITDALLMPLSACLMTLIAGRAVWWRWRFGGPRWKDRAIAGPAAKGNRS